MHAAVWIAQPRAAAEFAGVGESPVNALHPPAALGGKGKAVHAKMAPAAHPFNIWNLGTVISNNTQYGVTIATIWGGE